MSGLSVENAVKSYGTVKALDGASLTVAPGEFVALLGPNGAGKTTLFQLLTGLFVADSGNIRVDGHDIRVNAVPALAGLGVVFQQPTVDLDLTVAANLRFHARLHGMPSARAKSRIDEELARLGLTERAGDKARALSGGTRRRVELARALLHEPQILLMDEPTVGLDPASRRDLLAYVQQLCRDRRIGVLWATHLVEEVDKADRVVVLHKGKVLKTGTPADLMRETGKATLADAFLSLTGPPSGRRGGPPAG
ncbi:MAG TPA: ABC transporter ATP-binding protein [Candidatus Cybelea sp.]|nr:ABC transporter ATP-binding protein [Candidatus Cybelea sp.]